MILVLSSLVSDHSYYSKLNRKWYFGVLSLYLFMRLLCHSLNELTRIHFNSFSSSRQYFYFSFSIICLHFMIILLFLLFLLPLFLLPTNFLLGFSMIHFHFGSESFTIHIFFYSALLALLAD